MSNRRAYLALGVAAAVLVATAASAQPLTAPAETRAGEIEAQQREKAQALRVHEPGFGERLFKKIDEHLVSGHLRWHPFFGTAYQGAGFTLGGGYLWHLRDYDTLDVRAALALNRSKRAEAEYRQPLLFGRRGVLTALGGWREGIEIAYFGTGSAGTSVSDRTRFDFRQSYGSARVDVRPTRGALTVGGSVGLSSFEQRVPSGSAFERRYTADTLPGYDATVDYLQSQATVALDSRPAGGYARRGGYYGVTASRYDDRDGPFSFRQVDYDVVQHVPVLRDAWVLSLRGRVETTYTSGGDAVPFFMLPALGSGTTLRGFSSWRFRDEHSLLLSAEWRVLVNALVDASVFYDAGKVTARRSDLDLRRLKSSYGIGFRLHTLSATPIRIDLARSNEGFVVVFASTAAF